MQVNKAFLIFEIEEAFKDVLLENGIGLSEADAIDSYADLKFRNNCKKNDEKLNWQTISLPALNNYYNNLSFFDAKGMRFHLPTFIIADIQSKYNFGLAFLLANLSDHYKLQFELLSGRQRNTIKLYLEYLPENPNYEFKKPEIKRAIENYWQNKQID